MKPYTVMAKIMISADTFFEPKQKILQALRIETTFHDGEECMVK